jgi:hypothetical protein
MPQTFEVPKLPVESTIGLPVTLGQKETSPTIWPVLLMPLAPGYGPWSSVRDWYDAPALAQKMG